MCRDQCPPGESVSQGREGNPDCEISRHPSKKLPITRVADRGRDRHAREDQFHAYDHYLSFYWEHRTAAIEIVDPIGKGGDTITFNVTSQWPFNERVAELRFFYGPWSSRY